VVNKGEHARLTPEGRDHLSVLVGKERLAIDREAIEALYEEFTGLNNRFKALAVQWQEDNDEAILRELVDHVHPELGQLLDRLTAHAPRLAPYPARFDHAVAQLRAGDHAWFLRPMIESYHTVWFELHEDLIGLTGRTREAEAAAGRAA
jgi:pyruvate,orthophosphate dikinase